LKSEFQSAINISAQQLNQSAQQFVFGAAIRGSQRQQQPMQFPVAVNQSAQWTGTNVHFSQQPPPPSPSPSTGSSAASANFIIQNAANEKDFNLKRFFSVDLVKEASRISDPIHLIKLRDLYKKRYDSSSRSGTVFEFKIEDVKTTFNVASVEKFLDYLKQCGIKSFGEQIEKQLISLFMAICINHIGVLILTAVLKRKPADNNSFLSIDDFLNSFKKTTRSDSEAALPADLVSLAILNVDYVKQMMSKHPLVCSNLELARNWECFIEENLII
jgi:hypothetical protein